MFAERSDLQGRRRPTHPCSVSGAQVHRDSGAGLSMLELRTSDEQGLVGSGHPLDRGLGVWEILERNQEQVEIVGIGDDRPVVLDGNPAVPVRRAFSSTGQVSHDTFAELRAMMRRRNAFCQGVSRWVRRMASR